MTKRIVVLLVLFVSFVSCNNLDDKILNKSRRLLNESEVCLNCKNFDKSKNKARESLDNLQLLLKKNFQNVRALILEAKIHLTLLRIKNAYSMDGEGYNIGFINEIESLSYEKYSKRILKNVNFVLNKELTDEQQFSCHSILATLYRLKEENLRDSCEEYKKAINYAIKWKEGSEKSLKSKIQSQINILKFNQAEVCIMMKEWKEALGLLEDIFHVRNFSEFSSAFVSLEEEIACIEEKLKQHFHAPTTLRDKTIQMLQEKQNENVNKRLGTSAYNSYEIALVKVENELTKTKNHLIYRIMAYYNLNMEDEFKKSTKVLQFYYPKIEEKLMKFLEFNEGSKLH